MKDTIRIPINTFLSGNSYRANPYPTIAQIIIFSKVGSPATTTDFQNVSRKFMLVKAST